MVVLAICAAERIWIIRSSPVISQDGALYVSAARNWNNDPAAAIARYKIHMGYPAAMSAVHRMLPSAWVGDGIAGWELSGQIISLATNLAAIAGVWVFAMMSFDARIALVTALLFGLGRRWAVLGADVLTDSLAMCLQMWAVVGTIVVLHRLERASKWAIPQGAVVGLLIGGAYLVRLEALGMLPLAIIIWLIQQVRAPARQGWPVVLTVIGAAVLACAAISAPYVFAIGGLSKRMGDLVALPSEARAAAQIAAVILAGGGGEIVRALYRFVDKLSTAMHPAVAVLAGVWVLTWLVAKVGRIRLPKGVQIFPHRYCAMMILLTTAAYGTLLVRHHVNTGVMSHRYLIFTAGVLSPLAGAGLMILVEWIGVIGSRLGAPVGSRPLRVALLTAAIGGGMFAHALRPLHQNKAYYRQAADFVAAEVGPGDHVLVFDRRILHYVQFANEQADGTLLQRCTQVPRLMQYVREYQGTHVVIRDSALREGLADLAELIRSSAFTEIGRFEQEGKSNPDIVRVYRINRAILDSGLTISTNRRRSGASTTTTCIRNTGSSMIICIFSGGRCC